MATYDLKGYRKKLQGTINKLNRVKRKTPEQFAKIVQLRAKKNAPRLTGDTIKNIRTRKKKDGIYEVESWVPGPFKQNKWANMDEGYEAPPMRWNGYKPTPYKGAKAKWTGKARFFDKAVESIQRSYPKAILRKTRKAIRARL